jgi:hypothetical protein
MKKISRFFPVTLLAVTTVTISACSNGPSENDTKDVIQSSLGNCEYLSLNHFEKVNGMRQGDDHYLVDVKYTVFMKPTPDIKLMPEKNTRRRSTTSRSNSRMSM